MEMEATSSPAIFLPFEDNESFFLSKTLEFSNLDIKTTDKLRGRELHGYSFEWLILKDEEDQFSLWNPLTSEFICIPPAPFYADGSIPEPGSISYVITSPPHESNSKFVFFEKNSIFFCKIGEEHWTTLRLKEDFEKDGGLVAPTVCNGVIYCWTYETRKLVKIDLSIDDDLVVVVYDKSIHQEAVFAWFGLLIESCGELFLVGLEIGGLKFEQVMSVEVSRLDWSSMEWEKVENSFNDRAFFISWNFSSFSCSLTDSDSDFQGNHVYLTLPENNNVYAFNMDDKTISVSTPCLQFSQSNKSQPLWIMINSRTNLKRETVDDLDGGKKEKKVYKEETTINNDSLVKRRDFDKLHLDMSFEIGKQLILSDYINFRSVNEQCRLACPPIQWTPSTTTLESFKDYYAHHHSSLQPWLTYWQTGESICKCLDLTTTQWHFMNNAQKDVTMCHSNSGWCVVLHGETCAFLWNPLTKKTVSLPELKSNKKYIYACAMLPTVDYIIILYRAKDGFEVQYMLFFQGEWDSYEGKCLSDFKKKIGPNNNMVFYKRHLYLFDEEGNLVIFKVVYPVEEEEEEEGEEEEEEEEDAIKLQILDKVIPPPCSLFHQTFLMECNEKILSVFVDSLGESIRIFMLDLVKMVWVEIDDIGYDTLYVSRFSCFSTILPSLKMENRIYFPKYHEKSNNVVYYSLYSKKLHTHVTKEVLENFSGTKEQLYSCWVEPNWV